MSGCPRKFTFVFLTVFISSFTMLQCSDTSAASKENNGSATKNGAPAVEGGNEISIRQMWQEQEKVLKSFVSNLIKKSMPTLMREIYKKNITSTCLSSLLQLTAGLRQTKLWAFKMLDASGKIPTGFLSGTMTMLGNYQECLGIDIDQRRAKMKGQYCLVDVTPPLPKWRPFMSLHLPSPELKNISAPDSVITYVSRFAHNMYIASIKAGLCIPSSCSKDDAERLIQILPELMNLNWRFSVSRCETKESFHFSVIQLGIVYTFVFILIVVALGSLTDIAVDKGTIERRNTIGKICQVMRCFSLRVNMKSISSYVVPQENLSFVCGFTAIIMVWILAANAFMSINYDTAANFVDAIRMTRNMWYEIMMNRITPMQALLFFCAFVTTYNWMISEKQTIWKYLFKAYWRYTPTYMFLIALLMLTPGWGSGPSWMNYLSPTYTNCKRNWWKNLLYINNYVDSEEMCLEHSWFFAVAAQLHVIGLIVLIPLKRAPKVGLLLNLFLIIASLVTVFLTNMYYNILPNETMTFSGRSDKIYYATRSYHRLYSHAVFYCSGIFVGYFTATKPTMKIPNGLSWCLWVLTSAGAVTTVCVVHVWSDGNLPSPYLCASYAAFGKLLWATFLSWSTTYCVIERKGIFYDVTSWRPFSFLCRLMFIVLVINPSIVTMILSFKKAHVFISDFEIYYNLASLIMCNYIPAYAFHVAVESPLLQLTLLLKKACGMATSDTTSRSEKSAIDHQCEGVLTEKLPRLCTQSNSKDKKYQESILKSSNC